MTDEEILDVYYDMIDSLTPEDIQAAEEDIVKFEAENVVLEHKIQNNVIIMMITLVLFALSFALVRYIAMCVAGIALCYFIRDTYKKYQTKKFNAELIEDLKFDIQQYYMR